MLIGLSMATKVAPRSMTPGLRVAHERIAIVALVALGAHGLLLLGDSFLRRGRSPATSRRRCRCRTTRASGSARGTGATRTAGSRSPGCSARRT
jgi:hypothetical protein